MREYQGDIFGNWKPVEIVNKEFKYDKRFYSKLRKLKSKKKKGLGKNV